MIDKKKFMERMKFEDEILNLIDDQISEYQTDMNDGVDRSLTRSDLQGVVSAIVLKIINSVKPIEIKRCSRCGYTICKRNNDE